jgi:hypothetical protein
MTAAGTLYCAGLPGAGVNPEMVPEVQGGMLAPPFMNHQMTGLTGPEDGAGGARRDACTALHGPSDDIGVGPHENQLPNPRDAWGQTLQLRQRAQADDPGLCCPTGHRTRWTHPAAAISDSAGQWAQMPGAPKRTLSA